MLFRSVVVDVVWSGRGKLWALRDPRFKTHLFQRKIGSKVQSIVKDLPMPQALKPVAGGLVASTTGYRLASLRDG